MCGCKGNYLFPKRHVRNWNWLKKGTGEGEEIIWTRTWCERGGSVNMLKSTGEGCVRVWNGLILGLG